MVISLAHGSIVRASDNDIQLQYILYISELDQLIVSSTPIHVCNIWDVKGAETTVKETVICGIIKISGGVSHKNDNILYYDCSFGNNYTVINGGTSSNFVSNITRPTIVYNLPYNFGATSDCSRYVVDNSLLGDLNLSDLTIYTNVEWSDEEISAVKSYNPMSKLSYNLTDEEVVKIIKQYDNSKNYPGVSGSTSDELGEESGKIFNDWQSGNLSTQYTLQQLNEILARLIALQESGDLSIKDLIKINNNIEYNQTLILEVLQQSEFDYWDLRDISPSVSSNSQQSDSDEREYVDSILPSTTIDEIAPSQILNQKTRDGNIQQFLMVIWDNALIKLILPVVGGFAVIAVVLGRKFKL